MKKVRRIITVFLLFFSMFFVCNTASAKTLGDLKKELQGIKNEQAEMKANAEKVAQKIAKLKDEMAEIARNIVNIQKEQKQKEQEIKELEDKIESTEGKIKELVSFYQISGNENFYLKYLFGAESFTDFIYRFSVIEQLTKRSDELVDEMNDLIAENNQKIKELDTKQAELDKLNNEATAKLNTLGNEKDSIIEEAESYDSQINSLTKEIKDYEKDGCKDYQSLEACTKSGVPQSYNGFISPLRKGVITDNFGMRYLPGMGGWNYHSGIDIGGNSEGTPIKAAAAGRVSRVILYPSSGWEAYSCGGQQVFINHIVSGKYYTTVYKHLLTVNVKKGEIVSQGQVIGTQGGGRTSSYDGCTFGTHLHLSVATGHYYGIGSNSYSSSITPHLIEPRNIINYPAYGKWFSW